MAKNMKQTYTAPPRRTDTRQGKQKLSRKERKQQKKALRKQQLELEKQLVAEGKIPARNKYRAKSFFGRTVALCLTFLFGIVATVGAFFGFGAFAPVKSVFGLFGLDTSGILQSEYAAQSIFDLVGDVASNPFDSLESLTKYTPAVDKYLNTLSDSLSALGVELDKETIKTTKFKDLGTYFRDEVVDGVVLGKALKVIPSEGNRLIVAICYGNKGVDYTIGDNGEIVPITPPVTLGQLTSDSQSVIDRVCVEDAFGVTAQSNAAMRFLAYGTEGFNYIINDADEVEMLTNPLTGEPFRKKTIANLTSDGATPLETAKISDLITVEAEDGLLGAIKDWTAGDLKYSYRIERLRIDQVMDIDASSSPIARAIGAWRLSDLTDPNKMDTLKLGDVLEIGKDSPPILSALADAQLGELGTAVDDLRLTDILDEDDIAGNEFLRSLKFSPLTSLGDDLKKLSAADVFGEKMYDYLKPEENESKSFSDLYDAYKTGRTTKEGSEKIPHAYAFAEGEEVRSYFEHATDGTHLVRGFYVSADGGHEVVAERDVHIRETAAGEAVTVTYYTLAEQKLEPSYAWRYIDYENAPHIKPLPDGDSISSDPAARDGCAVMEAEGTAYLNGEQPCYYITTRAKFENGEQTAETERVAYPVLQDGNGIYYKYVKYTPDGGAAEFREVRVDLEREIVSYKYSENGADVTITRNAAGKWAYTPAGEETEKVVTVHTYAAETNPETGEVTVPAYDYFKKETPVQRGYYAAPAEGTAIAGDVYQDGEVTEKFEIVKIAEGVVSGDPVPVERYLSGVWFFLFGVDEEGNLVDRTDTPVLDLTDTMDKMSDTLSNTELWQLYFHGLLTANPFVDLTGKFPGGIPVGGEKTVTNLNECTVAETVNLVRTILGSS